MELGSDFFPGSDLYGEFEFTSMLHAVSTAERFCYLAPEIRENGMVSVFLPRGPWGLIHACRPEAPQAEIRTDSLLELRRALHHR